MNNKRKHLPEASKRRKMRHRYGIEPHEYQQMFIDQENKCATCGKQTGDTKGTRLYVDHDHTSNAVRGLLCAGCNLIAGALENEKTKDVIVYLRKHSSEAIARLELILKEQSIAST